MNEGWDYTEAPFDRTTIAVGRLGFRLTIQSSFNDYFEKR
jgi:hypothetical protein